MIAGPAGSDRPERFIPMLNAERSPTFYRFDSLEQLRVWREMDDRDEEPVVIYHSHTATEAYPSRTDISYASEPDAHYVWSRPRDPDRASSGRSGSWTASSPRKRCRRAGMIAASGRLAPASESSRPAQASGCPTVAPGPPAPTDA